MLMPTLFQYKAAGERIAAGLGVNCCSGLNLFTWLAVFGYSTGSVLWIICERRMISDFLYKMIFVAHRQGKIGDAPVKVRYDANDSG